MIKNIGYIILSVFLFSSAVHAADSEKEIFTKARALFAQKKFPEALALYEKIPTSSDRYFLAIEEKAWAYMHLDQYDKAIAEAQTLTSPALTGLTSTEPFLLKAIIQLKICDYVAVFKTLKEFKAQKRLQVEAIQKLAKNGHNEVSRATLEKWMLDTKNWKAIGPQLAMMPQLFYHDIIMLREAKKKNISAMEKRLKALAVIDNNENFRILQKLNLIEVESVQRVHIASQFDRKQGEQIEKGAYDFTFKDDKEVWLDEINDYQATINRCQKKSGRTM
jgi:tetratricopeptide (TPR) repeat protein